MSGAPAFQSSPLAFQQNAFQSGVQVVAGNYSLGSPVFAKPALAQKQVLSAPSYSLQSPSFAKPGPSVVPIGVFPYWLNAPVFAKPSLGSNYRFTVPGWALGSPVFAKPVLLSGGNLKPVSANPYSLGALAFTAPSLRQTSGLRVNAYSLGSPSFAVPASTQIYRLFANTYEFAGLSFAAPRLINNYQLSASGFALGPLSWSAVGPLAVNHTLYVNHYSLGSPSFGYPYMTWNVVTQPWPLTYLAGIEEASTVLRKMLDYLLASIPSTPETPKRNTVRRLIEILRADANEVLRSNTLGTRLGEIFLAADEAFPTYAGVENLRVYLMSQVASHSIFTQIVFRSALIMTLGLQSKIITRLNFRTQTQVRNMILHMRDAFDAAKAIGIDEVDVLVYQAVNAMGGALINHLATAELRLPQYLTYTVGMPMPSLYLANRIYQDASRADQIERDNAVVHPAFMPRKLRVLSVTATMTPLGLPLSPPGSFSRAPGVPRVQIIDVV